MGEIKGQLLGIILVLTIFALVGGVMVSAFNSSTSTISSRIAAEDNWDGK
ncbi:MAG: hypothetical protein VZR76_03740 [Candidatus Enteromonas sp.]|jgi:cytosine/uracil/thiamine/allantoin permease|nr:hypothetical protein [Bacilli bacterium]MCR5091766.1 hypothetical protein [Bacilli bacterium]MEE3402104.1 hypothetical protein [Candidatus Enteromonas sp.]MEE3431934.1 hypothetical protein [Candidatus Enteromonas sp.]MEE3442225.1 hypothetical protein [Candidatus Enteromonas sp.]